MNSLKYGDACYHSFPGLLYSLRLSRTLKVEVYKTAALRVVWYGCETWFLTLSKEHRLSMFVNRAPRRIFGSEREEVAGSMVT